MDMLENQAAAESVDAVFQDLETLLMQNIIRHCQSYNQPIATDEWLLQILAQIGQLTQENIQIIAQMTGLSQTAMERMLNETSEKALKEVEPALAYLTREGLAGKPVVLRKSKNVQETMSSMKRQTKSTLNLCNTTMLYKSKDAYKTLVNKVAADASEIANKQSFLDRLNVHATAATIGAESRQQAMRACIKEFVDKGIPAFVDKRGREWTPEAYVNMAMRNTAKNTADEVQTARCRDYGVNLIEIDSHSGARPKCAKDQGKIYDLNNNSGYTTDASGRKVRYYPWNSTSYGQPDGILGINCRHHKYPFVPGMSLQTYFPVEDQEASDRLYKQTQVQRALERDVRKQKRECMMYKELGDEEAFEQAAVQLKAKEAKLRSYVGDNEQLHRRKDREQVIGFDRKISVEAVAANKQYTAYKKSVKINTSNWESDAKERLSKDENSIRSLNEEKALIYDSSGRNVFKKDGSAHDVSFTEDEIKRMRGCVLTHNHPGGASLSAADINMLRSSKLSEIRAVGRDGVYRMIQPDKWKEEISSASQIADEYNKIVDELQSSMEKWALDNLDKITEKDYQIIYQNKVVTEFAKRFGLKYEMEDLKDAED